MRKDRVNNDRREQKMLARSAASIFDARSAPGGQSRNEVNAESIQEDLYGLPRYFHTRCARTKAPRNDGPQENSVFKLIKITKNYYRGLCFTILLFLSMAINAANPTFSFQVIGIQGPVLENVQKSVESLPRRLPEKASPAEINALFGQVNSTVKKALAPYGYFTPNIAIQNHQSKKNEWVIRIQIQTGPQTTIHKIHVAIIGAGAEDKTLQKALADFPLKIGMPLDSDTYEKSKKKFLALANAAGYMSPSFSQHEIKVNKITHLADIDLVFDTGPQYYFGAVRFNQSYYQDSFLQRFPQFKEGDAYSPASVLKLQENLTGTPYFSMVSVDPKQSPDDTDIPIWIDLTPSKAQSYNLGVGYGTDTGPRLTASWEQRHVTDTGQYLKTFLQLSTIQSTFDARYIIPGKDPINEQYYIGLSYLQQSPNTSNGRTEKVSLGKQQLWGDWTLSSSLSLQHDRYSLWGSPYMDTAMLLPSLTLYRGHYDDVVFPRNGYSASFTARGASKPTYSDTNFAQAEFVPRFIISPFDFSRIILRGDFGYTAIGDPNDLPLSLQFLAGGSDSIRGYDYQELGPGRYLFVGSAEYQQHVYKQWWGTVFMDAGNAVNSLENPQANPVGPDEPHVDLGELLKKSIGIGVMYASPVGPIELTIAKPLGPDSSGISVQFIMGGNI